MCRQEIAMAIRIGFGWGRRSYRAFDYKRLRLFEPITGDGMNFSNFALMIPRFNKFLADRQKPLLRKRFPIAEINKNGPHY